MMSVNFISEPPDIFLRQLEVYHSLESHAMNFEENFSVPDKTACYKI